MCPARGPRCRRLHSVPEETLLSKPTDPRDDLGQKHCIRQNGLTEKRVRKGCLPDKTRLAPWHFHCIRQNKVWTVFLRGRGRKWTFFPFWTLSGPDFWPRSNTQSERKGPVIFRSGFDPFLVVKWVPDLEKWPRIIVFCKCNWRGPEEEPKRPEVSLFERKITGPFRSDWVSTRSPRPILD